MDGQPVLYFMHQELCHDASNYTASTKMSSRVKLKVILWNSAASRVAGWKKENLL